MLYVNVAAKLAHKPKRQRQTPPVPQAPQTGYDSMSSGVASLLTLLQAHSHTQAQRYLYIHIYVYAYVYVYKYSPR